MAMAPADVAVNFVGGNMNKTLSLIFLGQVD